MLDLEGWLPFLDLDSAHSRRTGKACRGRYNPKRAGRAQTAVLSWHRDQRGRSSVGSGIQEKDSLDLDKIAKSNSRARSHLTASSSSWVSSSFQGHPETRADGAHEHLSGTHWRRAEGTVIYEPHSRPSVRLLQATRQVCLPELSDQLCRACRMDSFWWS